MEFYNFHRDRVIIWNCLYQPDTYLDRAEFWHPAVCKPSFDQVAWGILYDASKDSDFWLLEFVLQI